MRSDGRFLPPLAKWSGQAKFEDATGSTAMNRHLAFARLALLFCAAIALSAPAQAAAKGETRRQKPPPAVTLENKRSIALQSFVIVMAGIGAAPETIIGKLDKPLPAGEKADVKLDRPKGCLFEARWTFEDADDAGALDLCNDGHIVLVD
jgi:hypothetical protein